MLTKNVRRKSTPEKKVTKRYVRPKQTAEDVLRAMRSAKISVATIEAIEESAIRRRQIPHRSKG